MRIERKLTPGVLREAEGCIAAGGTLIFPTDTVYGIGCDPENESAVEAIFAAKGRPSEKPLAIHVADPEQAEGFADVLTPAARAAMRTLLPGPVAIIVKRASNRATAAARTSPTISIRCPDDAAARAILRATGPLAATSANLSDRPAYCGEDDSTAALPEATLAIITGPTLHRRESTVLDCTGDPVTILREGPVDSAAIAAALSNTGVQVV